MTRYFVCVRDAAAKFARTSSEGADTIAEAAMGACVAREEISRREYIRVMVSQVGLSAGNAQQAWDDEHEQIRVMARRLALAATMKERYDESCDPSKLTNDITYVC